ncbi:MAG TPA: ABC transporter ATP-binding protein, partial [bacterium]|nr:ABC transporter ATP-binding protein [bacterium]
MGATFVWPAFLWVLLSIPLLAVLYVRVLKRTSRHAVILSTTATLIAAKGGGKMRHLPPALLA